MNSKKKLSQIKSFAKGKVYEFIDVAGEEILQQLVLSSFTLHLDNYSYNNHGSNLISIKFQDTVVGDVEQLQQDIETICYENKLALYPIVDEELMELQFFNKALNNHIRTYQLIKQDERQRIEVISDKIVSKKKPDILYCIPELKELIYLSNDIHIRVVNRLNDEEDESIVYDEAYIDGYLKKINSQELIIDNTYYLGVVYNIDLIGNWEIVEIDNWEGNLKDITIEITV